MATAIELHNVKKTYTLGKDNHVNALNGIDLSIEKGEYVAICGVSGSGKSTLLHIIGCLDRASEGKVIVNGKDVSRLNNRQLSQIRCREIGFVLQDFGLIPYRTVYENVEVPLLFARIKMKNRKAMIKSALESVGIGELKNRKVVKMSGGQKQRAAIARAIVNNASIILADEPTGQLDTKTKHEMMDLFIKLKEAGKTIIVVTHDIELAESADRVIHIIDGKIELK